MTDQVKPNWVEKLKTRWQLKSNFQLFLVIVLFSITGSMSIKVARPILEFLGITQDMPPYFYWPLRILIVFPAYQMLFMIFGTMLGQWEFAWRFEKKMLSGLGRLVGIKPKKEQA
jgi:manganese efflux pump family protein